MKNIKTFIFSLLGLASAVACVPEVYELEYAGGAEKVLPDELVQGIAYSVTPDEKDPNTIYLKNLMDGYVPLWEHPQGRSQENEITIKLPFAGDYTVKFGVITSGGYVYGEPYTFTLKDNNLSYVDDPLWDLLTGGGSGCSKTWKLDIDTGGKLRYFVGPLYFYGTDDWYGTISGGQEAADYADAVYNGMDGNVDSWNWCADWAGNGSWLFGKDGGTDRDYGSITFDLIDGAHVTVVDNGPTTPVNYNGTFLLDQENYTLTLTDAVIPHDPGRQDIVTNWNLIRVVSITENTLQLGVIRDNDPSEGNCLLVYNFISQEWWDNPPVAEEEEPTEPVLPDNWQNIVGQITQTSIKWTLSESTPLNWHSTAGAPLNDFNSAADYPDWLGTPDPSVYSGFSLTMDSADNSYTVVAPDGTELSGTYTLDEKGIYTFDAALPSFTVINWAKFATDADNQLRILAVNTTSSGTISDMWVGAKSLNDDGSLKEYMSYHLVANVGGGSGSAEPEPEPAGYDAKIYFADASWDPQGDGEIVKVSEDGKYTVKFECAEGVTASGAMVMVVDILEIRNALPASGALVTDIRYDGQSVAGFKAANVIYGDLENNGNLRMEIYNEYGNTKTYGGAVDPSSVSFSTLEIDFEFKSVAYEAQVMMTNDGWSPGYSGTTNAGILGVGKHKIVAETSASGSITMPMVFCLDLLGYPDATTATAGLLYMKTTDSDGAAKNMTINTANLATGDLEEKGNLRWEFFNIYGSTGNGVSNKPYDYSDSVIDGSEWTDVASIEMLVSIE